VLAYFDRPAGPTEATNGRLEHLRRSALGFRNFTNYIARSLLDAGGQVAATPRIAKSQYRPSQDQAVLFTALLPVGQYRRLPLPHEDPISPQVEESQASVVRAAKRRSALPTVDGAGLRRALARACRV